MSDNALYEEWSHGLCIFIIKNFYEKNFLKSQQFIKVKAKEKRTEEDVWIMKILILSRKNKKKSFKTELRQMS